MTSTLPGVEVCALSLNHIKCLQCFKEISLSGSRLTKLDVSSICATKFNVEKTMLERKIRQEQDEILQQKINELSISRKRKRNTIDDDEEDDEDEKDMYVKQEVARRLPYFEKFLLLRTPCCDQVFISDGCQAIPCTNCNVDFCGFCLEAVFPSTKRAECHRHAQECPENEFNQGDYFTPSFVPFYLSCKRFAQEWNNFVADDDVSFDVILKLIEKITPMIQDSNLMFIDSGHVQLVLTQEQQTKINNHDNGDDEPAAAPAQEDNHRRARRARRGLCGYCHVQGHNIRTCPQRLLDEDMRRQELEDVPPLLEDNDVPPLLEDNDVPLLVDREVIVIDH